MLQLEYWAELFTYNYVQVMLKLHTDVEVS